MSVMLVDAGNSVIKWARYEQGTIGQMHQIWHRDEQPLVALRALDAVDFAPQRLVVGNVAGEPVAQAIRHYAGVSFDCKAEFAQVQDGFDGLTLAYAQPKRLGVDRWLAMLGALRAGTAPAVIADFGTAVTIDAIDSERRHLGGAIVPGRRLMPQALRAGTARIRSQERDDAASSVFAHDTGPALRAGADHALAALVERALHELGAEGIIAPMLLLTGGDAQVLSPLIHCPHRTEPALVLHGLAHWLERLA